MAEVTTYKTGLRDRWDNIAYKAYGDVSKMTLLHAANPGIAITEYLPAGIDLQIPILDDSEDPNGILLPPWLRED